MNNSAEDQSETRIFPTRPYAHYHVATRGQFPQRAKVLDRDLSVRIQQKQTLAAGTVQARSQGAPVTAIFLVNHFDSRVVGSQSGKKCRGVVAASVVDHCEPSSGNAVQDVFEDLGHGSLD